MIPGMPVTYFTHFLQPILGERSENSYLTLFKLETHKQFEL